VFAPPCWIRVVGKIFAEELTTFCCKEWTSGFMLFLVGCFRKCSWDEDCVSVGLGSSLNCTWGS
jgi:hypothetical protein